MQHLLMVVPKIFLNETGIAEYRFVASDGRECLGTRLLRLGRQ